MARIIRVCLIIVLFFSCTNESKKTDELSEDSIEIIRFEQQFYKASIESLSDLKRKYSFMFPESIHDSVWLQKINSEQEQFLYSESQRVFGDFEDVRKDLSHLFSKIKKGNSTFQVPKVVTHISNIDFQYPVIYADSLLFVSLDMYLGKGHEAYGDFPKYLSQNFTKRHLAVEISEQMNRRFFKSSKSRSFRDKMINEAKFVFANESNLPSIDKHIIIGYSEQKYQWAEENEADVWKYFIENELLYSTESSLNSRFLDIAPFSKFYLESDNDSPGRIGVWIGWQIINSFMKNNDVTLRQLMETPPEIIYNKSKYKPRK